MVRLNLTTHPPHKQKNHECGTSQSVGGKPVEGKLDFGFCHLSINLQHGISEEVDGSERRTRLDHKVAAAAEFNAVGRMMAEVIG